MPRVAVVWLRRDLRLDDNLALHAAVGSGAQVALLYVLDDAILNSQRVSAARVKFMCDALAHLGAALWEHGARLLVRRGQPSQIVAQVARELGAEAVYANRDYTPYARRRDEAVASALEHIPLRLSHDRILVAPDAIATNTGGIYTVFTPFRNKWRELPKAQPDPVKTDLRGMFCDLSGIDSLPLPTADSLGFESAMTMPEASPRAACDRLDSFTSARIYDYKETRNQLADPFDDPRNGTSSLSPYIRWGLLSLRQIRAAAADAYKAAPDEESRASVSSWMDEIVWHEFYTHILWHFPHVKTRNFNARYDRLAWRRAPDEFEAWVEGRTGYPVVDAAMRQLAATGWMHNRARMIVASFLTKDLLIDWREGELYFMRVLLDGDLAANNGGWQWAAGTGTDAQPYFRIFNPVAQSERFDPKGDYILKWVPELHGVNPKFIHAPWKAPRPPKAYPLPVVDHGFARERALAAFDAAKS